MRASLQLHHIPEGALTSRESAEVMGTLWTPPRDRLHYICLTVDLFKGTSNYTP